MRTLRNGGRMCVCGGTSGPKVELNLPAAVLQAARHHRRELRQPGGVPPRHRPDGGRAPVPSIDEILPLSEYPRAMDRLRAGDQLGKIVLEHPE